MNRVTSTLALLLLLQLLHLQSSAAQSCLLKHKFGSVEKSFKTCKNLVEQGATLSWTQFPEKKELEILFSGTAPATGGWVGWGINPGSAPLMFGASALVAFRASNGTGMLLTYKITQDSIRKLEPGPVDFKVLDRAVDISGTTIRFFARIQLHKNTSNLNHIWNRGSGMNGLSPLPHGQSDVKSAGVINIASGTAATLLPHQQLKNRHAFFNAIGWGLLLPLGVMSARYLKSFQSADPAWFYIHAFCQSSGYILGVIGWATGLKLGSYSESVRTKHRNLGIAIFSFATLQVLSLLLRPRKEHKIRKYWNVYHHTIGYATVAMIIVNIFEGFGILQPQTKWKHAYIGVIAALGGISLLLEIITFVYFNTKSRALTKASDHGNGNTAEKNWSNAQP